MSNISTADGRFIFDKAFVEKNNAVVSDWIENHRQSSYGFDIYGTRIDDDGSIAVTAIGRNTYQTTLKEEGIGWTTDDSGFFGESSRASLALGKALAENKSEVLIDYTDLEPDCAISYRAKAKLRYSSATEFTVEELELENLDLTFRVLVEAEYSEAAFDFKASDNEADVFKDFVRETYADEVKAAGFGIEAFCTAIVGAVKEDSYRDGLLSSYESYCFDELLHIVVAEAGAMSA